MSSVVLLPVFVVVVVVAVVVVLVVARVPCRFYFYHFYWRKCRESACGDAGDLSGMICGRVVASPDDDPEYTSAGADAIAGYDAEYSLAARNLSAAPSIRDRGALIF